MNFISIPVHEKPDVIINQIQNIKKYIDAVIILHVSLSATFSREELRNVFVSHNITEDDVIINPSSVKTSWGSIINAHLSNIDFLSSLPLHDQDKIIFHSSNDMLVKSGLEHYLNGKDNIFHTRFVDRAGYWWPARVALERDNEFHMALARVGVGRIVASQLEGSMYEFGLLKEISSLIKKYNIVERSGSFYPREEFYFSSFAYALGVKTCACPYIYSEVHFFDDVLWRVFSIIDLLPFPAKERIKSIINIIAFKSRFYKITPRKIMQVIQGTIPDLSLIDGGNIWLPYPDKGGLFGVKRVERDIHDSLRKYIKNEIN